MPVHAPKMDLGGGTYPPKSWWGWAINVAHGLGPLVPHLCIQLDSAPHDVELACDWLVMLAELACHEVLIWQPLGKNSLWAPTCPHSLAHCIVAAGWAGATHTMAKTVIGWQLPGKN